MLADGSYEAIPRQQYETRHVRLPWNNLTEDQFHYLWSFFHGFRGARIFRMALPAGVNTPSPTGMQPILDTVSGGSLGARTYDMTFSWFDSSEESEDSERATVVVANGELARIQIPASVPSRLAGFRVFASGTEGGTLYLQSSVTDATYWTEPTGGLVTGSAEPLTTSTLVPIKWFKINGDINYTTVGGCMYNLNVPVQEIDL